VTPVEPSIDAELSVEIQRFHNDWLFKWYAMTYEAGLTDVEDFRGGRVRLGGVTFGHQQQAIYWQAIDLYMRQKVHAVFKEWDVGTQSYPMAVRRSSIDGVEQSLGRFVVSTLQHALQTDKRLRGDGNPVGHSPPPGKGGVGAEVARLATAHRALIDQAAVQTAKTETPRSYWKWLEALYANNKGLIWFIGVAVAVVTFAVHFFQ
jgi:hypothetical protein